MNHTTLIRSLRIIIVSILIIQHTDDLLERMKKNKIMSKTRSLEVSFSFVIDTKKLILLHHFITTFRSQCSPHTTNIGEFESFICRGKKAKLEILNTHVQYLAKEENTK